ncbi:Gfo/Idh/MocA family oxidoreductase [bacterium]|nr:Gfo/Idh/MocA family oxidoreductase [bacterium]
MKINARHSPADTPALNRKPRIGIIGAGGIAGSHAQGFKAAAGLCSVVAVADPDAGRTDAIHELFGPAVRIVKDYRELLADAAIDAVDILLPHDLHMPVTVDAARAGKHVLVEKVMARTVAECDTMIAACDAAGVSLTVCHDRRYDGAWVAIKDIIDSGALGEVFFYKLSHNQNVAVPPGHWIRSRERLGGGAVISCLTHQIDALRWYGGEPVAVTSMSKTIPDRMEGETVGVIIARMASGALAELSINWCTMTGNSPQGLHYELIQVCGTKGEVFWKSRAYKGDPVMLRLYDGASPAIVERYGRDALADFAPVPAPACPGHEGCIREWVKMLRGEPAGVRTSGRACRGTVEVAEAAYRSETAGRTISLPLGDIAV